MEIEGKIEEAIKKWALKNAGEYGRAVAGKVVGKVIMEFPGERGNVKELMEEIGKECGRVNAMKREEILAELAKYSFVKKKEEGEKKIELPNAEEGRVVTRFPPEPSGYLHIGHAKAIFLNVEGAKQYGGKMKLRMDDTNPAKGSQEFVDNIVEDLKWLGVEWSGEITYSSDYMEKIYENADELILKNKAYACTCTAEEVKEGREKGKECLCRAKHTEENLHEFRKMMGGKFEEGEAVLRFRGNMKSENTVMRDPALFRVIKGEHFRKKEKYKCWPTYDFVAPILDSIEGVTHAMRSKEYELRDELYFEILDILELRKPELISFSRLAIKGAPVSKRKITPLIEEGKVSGYDDVRLPTLAALRRRGIKAEAIREFVLSFGLSKVESEPGWDKLLSINKKLIDGEAGRRFFVRNPTKLEISGIEAKNVVLKNHPQKKEMGEREVEASSPVHICGRDAEEIDVGEVFRLKDWCNVKLIEKGEIEGILPNGEKGRIILLKCEFAGEEGAVQKKVQWVSESSKVKAKVAVPHDLYIDGKYNENSLEEVWGWAERNCNSDEEREIFQFERYGFVVLDKKGEVLEYIFIS
ncbi:MAG: glutamate--tRNA ligase [Candidatus Micrarchaeota archaeon]